ncbi:hypothetical protein [Acinetobacter haemolyticus]|uniref:hypothetical protein n=1 Tax=Acinetobacter haemolyticus TaxID=29430 RepID=UPI000E15CB5B|nr:hypothetical protein [Acinetobacter haemolyticus]SUU20032.1 Uncharacterised protein [Acinetobacter haemolyticus]
MTLSQARNLYEHGVITDFEVWQCVGNYVLTVKIGNSSESIDTARGKQKLYKNFETVLNDYTYITSKEVREISIR